MSNAWDEVRNALSEARSVMRAADENANDMAEILKGRLRHVHPYKLAVLKRELRDFDLRVKEWKKP
jgi:hypothetical protein